MISTVTSTQVYKHISPIVRKSMTYLVISRLRNYGDLEYIIEEMSAIYDKTTLLYIYHESVSDSHVFLATIYKYTVYEKLHPILTTKLTYVQYII